MEHGTATFKGFVIRRFTPMPPEARADGEGEAEVSFRFTELHLDQHRNVEIGNAHFRLLLGIDKDADGVTDKMAMFPVNFHAEDPQ